MRRRIGRSRAVSDFWRIAAAAAAAALALALAAAANAVAAAAPRTPGATMLAAAVTPAGAVAAGQIVSAIDAERHANGLPLVREDAALSQGCAQYDRYRSLNGGVQDGFTPGPEDPSKPGYTSAGARAARDSLLNAGDRPADSWAAGDVFDDAPGHLFQLMSPDVATVGADQLEVDLGPFLGTAYISCVDTRSARYRPRPRKPRLYTYIGPNGTVPTGHAYREGPAVEGPLIFVYLDGPKSAKATLRSLLVQYPDGHVAPPGYAALTGGLRDGRRGHGASASKSPTGKFSSPQPSIVTEVGPPIGEGPYKLKMVYQYQEPGHKLVYSTTVPFSATVYGR